MKQSERIDFMNNFKDIEIIFLSSFCMTENLKCASLLVLTSKFGDTED